MEFSPDIFYLAGALLAAGGLAGFAAGLFGIGGGAVMVIPLFFAFTSLGYSQDVVMHCAVATSAAAIVINSVRSVKSHQGHGAVDWDLLWPKNPLQSYALWMAIGSFLAAVWLAPKISGRGLTIIFAALTSLISLQFIFGRSDWRLRDNVPGGAARPLAGGTIGVLSSLIGIGGGSFTVPLMSICGVPIHRAVATASGFGFAIALPAATGFIISGWGVSGRPDFSIGYVNVFGFMAVAALAFFTIPIGAALAHKLSQKKLRIVFGLSLLLISANMARKAVMG